MILPRTRTVRRFGFLAVVAVASCSTEVTVVSRLPGSITVKGVPATLNVGQEVQAEASVLDTRGELMVGEAVTWSTSSASVASVSASGRVRGLAPGTVTVSAAAGGVGGSAAVSVLANVASVTVSSPSVEIGIGDTIRLTAVARDSANTVLSSRAVTWSSSKPSVASVSNTGLVTALGTPNGALDSVSITATSEGVTGSTQLKVFSGLRLAVVTAGYNHSCGATSAGQVLCWGSSASAKRGVGVSADSGASPVPSAPSLASVHAGQDHSCGLTAAGFAHCWGNSLRVGAGEPVGSLISSPV
jgi:hypothetical protein